MSEMKTVGMIGDVELVYDPEVMEEYRAEQEVRDEYGHFIVNDDRKAEWCLAKIREAEEEKQRWIEFYDGQKEKVVKTCERKRAYLEQLLRIFFDQCPKKETKTQASYQLPSGKLVMKRQAPEFERNNELLLPWLKENLPALVKVEESPDWGNLKKHLTVVGDKAADPDGEIIPGITVVERPDVFRVEVGK